MANRSVFPNSIDTFIEFHDLSVSDLPLVQRYQELKLKTSRTEAEEQELNNLMTTLRDKIITAEDWNKFCDCIVNMEVFIRDNIVGFINTKQQEMQSYVDSAVNTVNTTKDKALIAIEQKKNNIIEYLDSTTAGELRNDIGVMGDLLTTDKTSCVAAINEIYTILNSAKTSCVAAINEIYTILNSHVTSNEPHIYGNRFKWVYNPATDSLDLVVI